MNVEVTEFSGPERSLLVIDGRSATAVAWKWERQEVGETHEWVCVALTTGMYFGHRAPPILAAHVGRGSLLATFSLPERQEAQRGRR